MSLLELSQSLVIRIPFTKIRSARLSFNHQGLHLKGGIDLATRERMYSEADCLRTPAERLDELDSAGLIGNGTVVSQTFRNNGNNPRAVMYTREHGFCQTERELSHLSRRPYYGIAHMEDGSFRGLVWEGRKTFLSKVRWWAAGIPVAWKGKVATVEQILPETPDQSHVWEDVYAVGARKTERGQARYARMIAVYQKFFHSSAKEAARALRGQAAAMKLKRQRNYLHNAVGAGPGFLVIVVAVGSLERIGRLALAAGASSAVVVDNGGSCHVGVRQGRSRLIPLIQAPNYREKAVAMAAYELADRASGTFRFAHREFVGRSKCLM